MIAKKEDAFSELKKAISMEKKLVGEMNSVISSGKLKNSNIVLAHINSLKTALKKENDEIPDMTDNFSLVKVLDRYGQENIIQQVINEEKRKKSFIDKFEEERKISKEFQIQKSERSVVKRLEQKKKETAKKVSKKPNLYAGVASRFFSEYARPLVDSRSFSKMIGDLLKTNLGLIPSAYISIILFSVAIASAVSVILFLFFLFFSISSAPPFIIPATDIISRLPSIFWILFVIPLTTFTFLYVYPSLERRSIESKIDQELPFATINMSAIAGSRIEPTNIFNIIISTGEYPTLKQQFTKVMNEINIYGHDLVTSLRNAADVCPSKKLSDVYNSLATNITSGGDLGEFFEKRSDSLLLDYRLERERYTRSSETFIDVYISVVIAAPMILMLLLMMIQVSGLGINLSPSAISIMMVLGVSAVNFVFLMFLRIKQPTQ